MMDCTSDRELATDWCVFESVFLTPTQNSEFFTGQKEERMETVLINALITTQSNWSNLWLTFDTLGTGIK